MIMIKIGRLRLGVEVSNGIGLSQGGWIGELNRRRIVEVEGIVVVGEALEVGGGGGERVEVKEERENGEGGEEWCDDPL